MCLVRPGFLWVGAVSGNIRVLQCVPNGGKFEIRFHATVVPGLETTSRMLTSRPWIRPMRSGPSMGSIENIPEDFAVDSSQLRRTSLVTSSGNSLTARMREAGRTALQQWGSRAHSSHVRCIFARGGRVWTAGGRMRSSIKIWNETNHNLEAIYTLYPKGLCVTMAATPWQGERGSSQSHSIGWGDWRLLTAHETGLMYLWDPAQTKPMRPLLEIETRKSPIKSLLIFEKMGVMYTAHKDGSVAVGRLLSPQMCSHGLTASGIEDDDEIFPFVPRIITEDLFPGGINCAVAGADCLYIISNRGEILFWPRAKLSCHANVLKRSSSRRMPVQVVNESVMVIDKGQVTLGETIYEGDFARVKRGKFLAKDVVIKEAKEASISRRAIDALVKDAGILAAIRHPNIVNIMAVCNEPPFVVMQYYEEGSLYEVLKACRKDPAIAEKFTWEKRLTVAIDICCGMIYLHSQNPPILHRDLKSPNVFIEKDYNGAAVGDFNLSKNTDVYYTSGAVRPSNPMWQAPEVAKGAADFSIAADIYSFGILLWELTTAQTPWEHLRTAPGMGREILFGKIRYELFDNRRPQLKRDADGVLINVSGGSFPQIESYVKLMEDCWTVDPKERPSSFHDVVGRLEYIKGELQDYEYRQNLRRGSVGRRDEGEAVGIRQRLAEGLLTEESVPTRAPVVPATLSKDAAIPQSPFDGEGVEGEEQEMDQPNELPVSPFN